jgi:rSAM/selenodomain-associated transferase 2
MHLSRVLDESSEADQLRAREVSIIIPIGPGDESWRALLWDLSDLPFTAEILCVATEHRDDFRDLNSPLHLEWIVTVPGRAQQMNVGASRSQSRFLWFLHADSQISPAGINALARGLVEAPQALHYFNLIFAEGPWLMRLNAWGVWWRSHLLGMPFGDQGLCLQRDLFTSLEGYSESVPYGEDLDLVWRARRLGMRLRCTGATLITSARKYRERGWGRTTLRHLWGTFRLAWPHYWLWLRGR